MFRSCPISLKTWTVKELFLHGSNLTWSALIIPLILSLLQYPLNIFLLEDMPVSEYSSLGDSSAYLLPFYTPMCILFASRANSRSHRTRWGIPHALRLNDSENGDACIRSCLFKTLHRRGMQHICLFEKGILSWLLLELLNGVQFLNMWNYTFLLVFVHNCFISSTFQTCEASSLLSFSSFTH